MDGILLSPSGACTAYAAVHSGSTRAKLECSDLHKETKIVADVNFIETTGGVSPPHTLACPEGFRVLHCNCYSAWRQCGDAAWGFAPATESECVAPSVPDGRTAKRKLSAICVDNS